jgi:uncharacterized membrane protein
MKILIKHIFRLSVLGTTYGLIYMGIELMYRQRTTLSMGILAFIVGILIGLINEIFTWGMSLIFQGFIGMLIATLGELICGLLINQDYHIWSYIGLPFNFMGQACLYFSICWFFIALICILLDDWLREVLFKEERKKYKII